MVRTVIRPSTFPSIVTGSIVLALGLALPLARGEEHPGAKVYVQMCAECHGKKGEGVAGKHDEPLIGNKGVVALTKYIARTMPEDKEGTCVGPDAENVAAYIFDAFYSRAAQARNHPIHEDLSRLTVAQYQNSVTDLIGRFRPGFDRPPGKERGLRASYRGFAKPLVTVEQDPQAFAKDKKEKEQKKDRPKAEMKRVDAQIAFQFGSGSPNNEEMDAAEFNNRWDGTLIAPETGLYEFIVKTENGFRLYVNNAKDPIIDSWVTPGPQVREEKKAVFLLGGRSYPFSLEHFKFKEKSASIELRWKPPHGREEVIPQEHFEPQGIRENFVLSTPFPADDRSDGYERGTTISKEWDQATTDAALQVAGYVDANLDGLSGTKDKQPDRVEKLKKFAQQFAEAAWRRPLDDEQKQRRIEHQFQTAPSPDIAVKRVVLLALKSPRFLYPELSHGETVDDFTIAARLAGELWDSLPDTRLAKAASDGKLHTRDQVTAEARRMVADPRSKAKLRGFFQHWLELDRADNASKDAKVFPGFDETMMADLRESLWMFLDEVVWSEKSDYRQLINADYLWLNERLAKFYGKDVKGEVFQRVAFDPAQRSGVITHPFLLAALAYARSTSPIHRGVFLSRNIVGLTLKNPSVAVAFEEAKFDPSLTMREKVSDLTKAANCQGCHSHINPLGFSLEHYDAVGRWRTKDNNKPVDAIAEFDTEDGEVVKLTGPKDLADYAVNSESAHRAFVRQLFNHTVKLPAAAFGEDTLDKLRENFAANGFNIQKLIAEIATTAALDGLPKPAPKVAQTSSTP
jgi:cytochrome c553